MMYDELINKLRIGAKCFPGYELYGYAKEPFRLMPEHLTQAADAIEDLDNRLNLHWQGKIGHWIPVTERLPEEDGKYLTVHTLNSIPPQPWIEVCWFAKDLYKVDKYDFHDKKKKSGFYQYDSEWGNFEKTGISHWMPLPEPPKEEI